MQIQMHMQTHTKNGSKPLGTSNHDEWQAKCPIMKLKNNHRISGFQKTNNNLKNSKVSVKAINLKSVGIKFKIKDTRTN